MSWKKIAAAALVCGIAAHWVRVWARRAEAQRIAQRARDQQLAEERWEDEGGAMLPPWRNGADESEIAASSRPRQAVGV